MTTTTLPHWDMTVIYPSLDSPECTAGIAAATAAISELGQLFDRLGVAERPRAALDAQTVSAVEEVLGRYNAVIAEVRTLSAYLMSFVATDSRNDAAQAMISGFQQHTMRLSQLGTRFAAWIGSLDVEALITESPLAAEHSFVLRKACAQAQHLMSPAEEALATELNLSSGTAWAKLHGNLTSQLTVPFERDGVTAELPMSMIRNLAYDPDRAVRRRAYEAELAGWACTALPLAAALNGIKGEVNTLARQRGWESPLDTALLRQPHRLRHAGRHDDRRRRVVPRTSAATCGPRPTRWACERWPGTTCSRRSGESGTGLGVRRRHALHHRAVRHLLAQA